jgi:hypothetical protein
VPEGEDLTLGCVAGTCCLGGFHRPEEGDQRPLDLQVGCAAQGLLGRRCLPDVGPATEQVDAGRLRRGEPVEVRKVRTAAPIPSPQRCSTAQTVREVLWNFGKIARLISLGARSRA